MSASLNTCEHQYNVQQRARIIEQCNVMHWNVIEHNTKTCNPLKCSAIRCTKDSNAMHARIIEQCNVMHWNVIEHNTTQCNPMKCSAILYKKITAMHTANASLNKHAWLHNRVKGPQLHWHYIYKTYIVFCIDIHAPAQCSLYRSVLKVS